MSCWFSTNSQKKNSSSFTSQKSIITHNLATWKSTKNERKKKVFTFITIESCHNSIKIASTNSFTFLPNLLVSLSIVSDKWVVCRILYLIYRLPKKCEMVNVMRWEVGRWGGGIRERQASFQKAKSDLIFFLFFEKCLNFFTLTHDFSRECLHLFKSQSTTTKIYK